MKSKILIVLHLFRQISRNINYGANEEFFWDQYVKDWEKSEKLKDRQ